MLTYDKFLHICRTALEVAHAQAITVFGANAIVPWLHERKIEKLPGEKEFFSRELDVTVGDEVRDTLIDGTLGEGSMFDKAYGYYAHGTGMEGCIIPKNWTGRAKSIVNKETGAGIIVPTPHDIIISKLVAGREKDIAFVKAVMEVFPISSNELEKYKKQITKEYPGYKEQAEANIGRFIASLKNPSRIRRN